MATQTTGNFWDISDPRKPIGDFIDPDDELDISIVVRFWLDANGEPRDLDPSKCFVDGFDHIDCNIRQIIKNIVTVRVKRKSDVELVKNKIYPMKLSLSLPDGQVRHKTFWLRVKKG